MWHANLIRLAFFVGIKNAANNSSRPDYFDNSILREVKCMKSQALFALVAFFATVLFSYGSASAQVVEKTKEVTSKTTKAVVDSTKKAASVTKDATTAAASKTKDVVTDSADKTTDVAKDTAGVGKSKSQSFGKNTVTVTENIAGQAYEGGKYLTVTTWDGTKWVSKQVWQPNKKQ